MSRAETIQAPAVSGSGPGAGSARPSPLWTFGLLRSELVTTVRRWRTIMPSTKGPRKTPWALTANPTPKGVTR